MLVARQAWLTLMVTALCTSGWVKWWLNYDYLSARGGAESELLVMVVRVVILVSGRVGRKVSW